MEEKIRDAIFNAVEREPFAVAMGIQLKELDDGYSLVEMQYEPEKINNIYERAHGGGLYSL